MPTLSKEVLDYTLVAGAIEYITEHRLQQPSLDDIAQHLDVSPSYMQRVFTRWAGVSPKRFLQYLTLEHAKQLLDESQSVMDAAYEIGLSSPSRLHDLFITVDGVTPGEYKKQGDGIVIHYGTHATPFGDCLIAVTKRGVCGLYFMDYATDDAFSELRMNWPQATMAQDNRATKPFVKRIFDNVNQYKAPLPIFLKGTNFQLKVWKALLTIPLGSVVTYGDVAQAIRSPSSSRAVGNAVGNNAIGYLIPCHRVIRSSGVIDNYRWGSTRKLAILGWEASTAERLSVAD